MSRNSLAWLGEYPNRWNVIKLRQLLRPFREKNHADMPLLSVVREKGVIVRNVENKEENHNYVPDDLSNYKLVKCGQFAMNKMKAWQGSYGISKYDGIVSPAYFVFDVNCDLNSDFFNYAIRSKAYVSYFGQASDGIRVGQWDLSMERMKEIPFLVPPRDEQDQIVRFLDWKVSSINKLIRIKRKQIVELEEMKKICINDAVTGKTLFYKETKDSGFDFIGEIPSQWEIVKLKWLLTKSLQYGANATGVEFDTSLPRYIRITDITIDNKLKETGKVSLPNEEALNYILEDNDILFARSGATVGKSFIYKEKYGKSAFAGYLIRVKIDTNKALPEYVYAVTLSRFYELWKDRIFIQATIQNISAEKYNNLPIPLPPIEEQKRLVQIINQKVGSIETMIAKTEQYIQELIDLKIRLIADTVTGKIDVRGVEIPEYEYTEEDAAADSDLEGDESYEEVDNDG